jgi:hypothetical protein
MDQYSPHLLLGYNTSPSTMFSLHSSSVSQLSVHLLPVMVTFAYDRQFALGDVVQRGLDGTQRVRKQWEA